MQPFAAILLALAAVILTGQILARVLRRFGQPAVIGEVLAGILLGPSLIGAEASSWILPASIAPALSLIASAGVVIYMFLAGVELETGVLRSRRRATLLVALTSVAVPFAAGAALAPVLRARLAPDVPAIPFTIFIGIAMAVTAFPVLARILRDRGIERTAWGVVALSAAAIGDVLTWLMLAALAGATNVKASSLLIVGAFLAGAAVPARAIDAALTARIMRVVAAVLLPAFFAFTGMRTRIDLVDGAGAWLLCGLIILVAVAGKFAGALAGARLGGLTWREGTTLGILLNARGLMELVVLNIGLEIGIIPPPLFAMMVMMAIVTTMMTGPLLKLTQR